MEPVLAIPAPLKPPATTGDDDDSSVAISVDGMCLHHKHLQQKQLKQHTTTTAADQSSVRKPKTTCLPHRCFKGPARRHRRKKRRDPGVVVHKGLHPKQEHRTKQIAAGAGQLETRG
jgi:hypothetical protein